MVEPIIKEANDQFQKALEHLQREYGKLQTGRANAALVENLMVESYGAKLPLKGLASISVPEVNQIAIQPWNRDQIPEIEKAIRESSLGLNPQNNGLVVRLTLPPLTEERRKDLVKLVHKAAEEARISVRNTRHEALHKIKEMEKSKTIGEDQGKDAEETIQKKVDDTNRQIEEAAKHKEKDVMTV